MNKPPANKAAKPSDASRAAATGVQVSNAQTQLAQFEAGMKLFHTRRLQEARDHFRIAAEGPERDVAQRARLNIVMCDRRLQQTTVNLRSSEDHYNYGVALLNTRKVEEARSHLEQALELAPEADHIHYALALAQALSGDLSNAHDHLKRAIDLEPRNRLLARQDADFAPILNLPAFDLLIHPEKKNW